MHKNLKTLVIGTLAGLAAIAHILLTPTPARASPAEAGNLFGSFNLSIGTLAPAAQVDLLLKNGYDGIVLSLGDAATLRTFSALPSLREGKFKLIANFWAVDFSKPIKRDELNEIAQELKKAKADLWVVFQGHAGPQDLRNRIGEVADIAKAHGVTVVLYPHDGSQLESGEEALSWKKAVGRDNVKIAVHLCHELKAGNGGRLPEIIEAAAPYLGAVTINGADRDVGGESLEGDRNGYDHSIQTLGQGDFNVRDEFYLPLVRAGYQGPFVLHDFGIKEPPQHFARSMATWKSWLSSVAR